MPRKIVESQSIQKSTINHSENYRQNAGSMRTLSGAKQKYKPPNEDEIPPELAAQIVKTYILPMFESTGKKELKNKYNKI